MAHHISICICTRNRPDELKTALESLSLSNYPIFEIIVSDDSTNIETATLVQMQYPHITYLSGPRQGLGANRNRALTAVTGSHVLFIDDDVVLGKTFLETVFQTLDTVSKDHSTDGIIVTGIENKHGELVFPHEQDFLGFQKIDYPAGSMLKTVVINSTVFPSSLFQKVQFDEKLVYGCDEVDLTTRAVCEGYQILLCSQAINFHYPSKLNRDFYQPYHEASRLYVTFKRYFSTEKNGLKAIAYLVIALSHTIVYTLKVAGLKGLTEAYSTFQKTCSYIALEYFSENNRSSLRTPLQQSSSH